MDPKIVNITAYIDYVRNVNKLTYKAWVYRGHSDTSWRIESTLARYYRTNQERFNDLQRDSRELDAIRKFQRAAHQYLSHLPGSGNLRSWLAIMQHFGAPTRLIDSTLSPFVGLYFAATGSLRDVKYGELLSEDDWEKKHPPFDVHAVNVDALRALTKQRGQKAKTFDSWMPDEKHYRIGKGREQKIDFIGFFEGAWQNPRQIAQQSVFLVPSKVDMDVHGFLTSMVPTKAVTNPWLIFRFKGGQKMYKEMMTNLISANLTAASLFPGIEGLARSMYLRMFEGVKLFD